MIRETLFASVFVIMGTVRSGAIPMDAKAGERIPQLRRVVAEASTSNTLSRDSKEFLCECIESSNDVLLSITAWLAGEYRSVDEDVWAKVDAVSNGKLDRMSSAFIRIAREKREARKSNQQWRPSEVLLSDKNPFVRTEAARELLRVDKQKGRAALEDLRKDKKANGKFIAARLLEENRPPNRAPLPIPDERYSLILSIIHDR